MILGVNSNKDFYIGFFDFYIKFTNVRSCDKIYITDEMNDIIGKLPTNIIMCEGKRYNGTSFLYMY